MWDCPKPPHHDRIPSQEPIPFLLQAIEYHWCHYNLSVKKMSSKHSEAFKSSVSS